MKRGVILKYDIVIKDAKIVDGTNMPWFIGDIGILGDRIAEIGNINLNLCKGEIIDANGLVAAPGFIDSHTHFDLSPFDFYGSEDITNKRRLMQGITTQIVGCCGISPAPMSEESKPEWLDMTFGIKTPKYVPWTDFKGYMDALSKCDLGTNYACYVGQGAIRHSVMGFSNRKPTENEINRMKQLLRDSISAGAIGMSTGLIYAPGVFSEKDELQELCSVLSETRAIYASHIRNENAKLVESVAELIDICEANRIPGIVHQLKTKAKDSKNLVAKVLNMINDARGRGVDVIFEQYPYEASSTGMTVVLSSWMREGSKDKILKRLHNIDDFEIMRNSIMRDYGWKNICEEWEGAKNMLVLSAKGHDEYIGKTIFEIARELGKEPIKAVFDLLIETKLESMGAFFGIKEDDICTIMQNPYGMIGSDSDDCKPGETTHPRTSGTFPRVIGDYAMKKGVISLENAIYKMTGFPATKFGLIGRGLIKAGCYADIVLFDENEIIDRASYLKPFECPSGIKKVIVNGLTSMENGIRNEIYSGRLLRR